MVDKLTVEFLTNPEIEELLAVNNLQEVYKRCPFYMPGLLTDVFYAAGIDPLLFLEEIPSYFVSSKTPIRGTLVIPDNVVAIGEHAFSYLPNLMDVYIPDSVQSIGKFAFENCINLKSVKLSKSVKELYPGCFSKCYSLLSVEIPDSVEYIDARCFESCKALTRIMIGSGVKYIGIKAFAYAGKDNITRVEFNNTKEAWNSIDISPTGNDILFTGVIHCTDGDVV